MGAHRSLSVRDVFLFVSELTDVKERDRIIAIEAGRSQGDVRGGWDCLPQSVAVCQSVETDWCIVPLFKSFWLLRRYWNFFVTSFIILPKSIFQCSPGWLRIRMANEKTQA